MAFCEECGTELEGGARFCSNCGHEVATKAEPAAETKPAEPAVQVVEELVGTVMREVDAPSAIGESTLCTWKNAGASSVPVAVVPAATQAIGTVAQKAANAGAEQVEQGLAGETAQFVSHRTTVHSSSQNRGEALPAAKKSRLPLILVVVGVMAIVAIFALYVVPRFISHPVDPNEHTALVPSSSQSASSVAASSEGASSTATSSASSVAASTSSSSDAASTSASAESSSPAAATTGYSTDERPTINDFKWLDGEAMKGNAPADAQRIVDFGALTGGWKGYIVGPNMEWLANADIEAGQAGATIAIDWYYIRAASGDVQEDTTPTSSFTGSFDGGMLDATGSGRITIAAFWQKGGRQYGVGSYMWPSGESATIALVRP